jgi:hypothetical protein
MEARMTQINRKYFSLWGTLNGLSKHTDASLPSVHDLHDMSGGTYGNEFSQSATAFRMPTSDAIGNSQSTIWKNL